MPLALSTKILLITHLGQGALHLTEEQVIERSGSRSRASGEKESSAASLDQLNGGHLCEGENVLLLSAALDLPSFS